MIRPVLVVGVGFAAKEPVEVAFDRKLKLVKVPFWIMK